MKAVKRGHVEVANELKTRGADKTIKNKNGDTVYQLTLNKDLLSVSVSGDAASVTSLLQQGASVFSEGVFGDSGLQLSAKHGHDDIVKIFLNKGAEVNCRGSNQLTPLMWAALNERSYKQHTHPT